MNTHVSLSAGHTPTKLGVVDCDIHPMTRSPGDLKKYLPARWHEHHENYGDSVRQPFVGGDIYPRVSPYLSRQDAYPPTGGPPGCDLPFMREQLLDPFNIELGVMQPLVGGGTHQRVVEYGAALCGAVNEWQIAEWTSQEPRLKASISITQEYPEAAIATINRYGGHPDFVQVGLYQRSLEPAGRRRYWPIYAAAVEHDKPIGIHTGGYNGHPPVAGGGWPSYYAEQHQAISLAQQSTLASLVMEGVFEAFPDLRVLLIEGGFAWVPAAAWRLDKIWEKMRDEVPHLKHPPSHYIRRNVWFSTQPMDGMTSPEQLRQVFDWVGWDRLCFASDYPHWDFDDANQAFPLRMSEAERQGLFNLNARRVFGGAN